MKKYLAKVITGCTIIVFAALSGCSMIKTFKAINGANLVNGQEYSTRFEVVDNTIFIKVKINNSNKEYNFIFDTGAINVIDEKLADELGLKKISSVDANDASNISKKTYVVKVEQLAVGDIIEKDLGVVSLNLDFLSQVFGRHVDGIIGNNFVKFFTITMNFQDITLAFSNHTEPINKIDNGYIIPFKQSISNGYAPQIKCTLDNGYTIDATIDCGYSSSICIPERDIVKGGLLKSNPHISSKGHMSAGAMGIDNKNGDNDKDYLIRLQRFDIGSLHCSDLLVQSTSGDICMIGTQFLSQFTTKINYPASQLILIPVRQPITFINNRTEIGLGAIKADNGNFKVIGIWETSQADSAGINIGDEIIELNNIKTSDLSNKAFSSILNNDNISLFNLRIKNNGIERIVELKKQSLLK
jgi:predicted aspartyl protease